MSQQEGPDMDRSTDSHRPSALLLQEALFDSRVWDPVVATLGDEFELLETTPPVIRELFSDTHWASHTERWVSERFGHRSVDTVVGHGRAASAAILVATRGLDARSILLIEPTATSVIPELDVTEAHTKLSETLQDPEAARHISRVVSAIDEDELRELPETGRLSETSVGNLIDASVDEGVRVIGSDHSPEGDGR
ncbi:hypothetical protein GCM10029992_04260 [Glycomyces albus]